MNISTNLNWRCLLAAALCILMLAVHSSDLADTAKSAPSGSERLVFKSSFEQEPLTAMAPQHELVRGVARTGQCSLMGQVSKPNDACVLKIPFEAKKNGVLLIRYWVRCDNKSTAATFVRIGKKRIRIGPRVDKIASDHWTRVKAQYRAATDVSGTIEVIAPSSHSAPMGKAWIDDIEIREVWDEFSWPDHVEDFPAIANDSMGQLWLASLGRQVPKRFIRVYGIDGKRRTLMCTIEPTGTTGIAAPAIAGLEKGCLVAFPVEQEDRWRIAYALVGGKSSENVKCRYIDSASNANISPALATVGARVCVLWESNAGNARGIYACWIGRDGPGGVERVSCGDHNSYNPAVVALANGSLFAAWDSVRDKSADIYGAHCRDGKWQDEQRITCGARVERHPSLAAWKDEVWMAWQAQSFSRHRLNNLDEQRLVVAKIDGGQLLAPLGLFAKVSRQKQLFLRPRIGFDAAGRLWLTAREATSNQGWQPMAWCYSGQAWSDPRTLMHQPGRWRPVALANCTDGLLAAVQFDDMADHSGNGIKPDWRSGVALRSLSVLEAPVPAALNTTRLKMPPTRLALSDDMAFYAVDLPRQRWEHNGDKLTLFWGDLHDHTDLSICARSMNPPGHDLFANVRDIDKLDFCALTDHGYNLDNPIWAYNGEQTRNNHDPGRFVTLLGQEWTSKSNPPAVEGGPNRYGHRNLIFLNPHYRHFHDAFDGDITPTEVWSQVKGTEFVSIPHQLADWQHKGKGNPPTDWNHVDEELQPLAEIWQVRGSYEGLGCPRQAGHGAPFKGYYLQDAWANEIVIGVIASPDHGGGIGKAGVWAKELTRKSVFRALQARHTFGTSGAKMALRFSSGQAMMGDKVTRPDGAISFKVSGLATHDIREVVILRNNEIVHRTEPGKEQVDLEWTDNAPPNEKLLWYYARIQAVNDELAWSSPIWFVQ